MRKYLVTLDERSSNELERVAREKNIPPEQYLAEVVNLMLVRTHSMQEEEIAKGYIECGALNLMLSE